MEFVLRVLQQFPLVAGHLVRYQERAVCPLCQAPMQQVLFSVDEYLMCSLFSPPDAS
jgi:hypothetical protein